MKFLKVFLMIIFISSVSLNRAQAMDARGKAVLTIAGYGTAGGALLGFASMAFGTNARAIAQGASLGLYAGIIFGTYIVVSHAYANSSQDGAYPDGGGVYNTDESTYNSNPQYQLWDSMNTQDQRLRSGKSYDDDSHELGWSMNFLHLSF